MLPLRRKREPVLGAVAEPGDELGVVAGAASHDEGVPALDAHGSRPVDEERVRRAAIPWDDRVLLRRNVQPLEPADGIAASERLRRQGSRFGTGSVRRVRHESQRSRKLPGSYGRVSRSHSSSAATPNSASRRVYSRHVGQIR